MSESDIDRLVAELNALDDPDRREAAPPGDELDIVAGDTSRLIGWLRSVVQRHGSDLLLVSHAAAAARVDKRIVPIGDDLLTGDEIERAVLPALPPHARALYARDGIADASFAVTGIGRFRVNLHRERGRAAATIRALPRV
ncbi:MAG: hypothetical protein H0V80_14465, partial [Acidobacteria bacterium]|nr:hypothetical protein [Acidobacteriota bacterium]